MSDSHPASGDVAPISARDALLGRERIRGASRVIAEGTDAAAVTAEQIQQVASDVELFCRSQKISRKLLARSIGYSAGVISEFVGGNYRGNRAQVAIDLEGWLVEEEQWRERPETTQFVWTNVALEIKAVANYCLERRKIGLIFGGDTSGLGKTTALKAIHMELGPRRSTLVTIDKVDANPTGLLVKICQAMHVADHGSCRNKFRRIVEEITGRSHLLILDQIHNLRGSKDDKPFYLLTDLHDSTQTAQLWSGTANLLDYLSRQQTRNMDESLAQVRRRVFPVVNLFESLRSPDGGGEQLVTVDQVREMFAKNKLRLAGAAARFLCALINQPDSGGVGLCVQIFEYATMLGGMCGATTIDVAMLKEALRRAFSPQRTDELLNRMADAPARAPVAAMVG